MDLRQLRYFIQLVQFEHVSKTADFLNISQPTLGKSVNALEKELGILLFDRIGNRIRLNSNGRRFYDYVRESMKYLDTGIMSARQNVFDVTGQITVSCWCFASLIWPCTAEYQRLNPKTNFTILQSNFVTGTSYQEQNPDFILRSYAGTDDSGLNDQFWVKQKLFSESNYLVVGPAFPLFHELTDHSDSVDLTLLKDAPFVTMKVASAFFNEITYQICQNAGFWPHTYFQTDDFLLKMSTIRSGTAIAFLPNCCLDSARMLCPGLRALSIRGYDSHREIALLRKKKVLLSEAALDFWDFVLDYYNLPPDSRE